MGTVVDPFGHKWTLGTHIEDVAPEEMQKRMEAWSKQARRLRMLVHDSADARCNALRSWTLRIVAVHGTAARLRNGAARASRPGRSPMREAVPR